VLRSVLAGASATGTTLKVLGEAGVIRPHRPLALARAGLALKERGTGPAGGFTAMALLEPGRTAVVDELGSVTFGEMHRRSNALARALAALGVAAGDSIALMCRNHRGFIDTSIAAAKLGADILYLNTAFAGPQLVDVLERERPAVVVHDEEFTAMLEKADVGLSVLAWTDTEPRDDRPTLAALIAPSPATTSRRPTGTGAR